jgi:hypothetical protein
MRLKRQDPEWVATTNARRRERRKDPAVKARCAAVLRKSLYGLTRDDYDKLLSDQGGVCAICGTSEPGGRGWHVDHCHADGFVRGLLCSNCNTALGLFKDNPITLIQGATYLRIAHEHHLCRSGLA